LSGSNVEFRRSVRSMTTLPSLNDRGYVSGRG
jgi:hypothetical protein